MKKSLFESEYDEQGEEAPKIGVKKVSSQKSIFDQQQKKKNPTENLDKRANDILDKSHGYQQKIAELALQFKKIMMDKTLDPNKSPIAKELEKDTLKTIIRLASEINNDVDEKESEGSLSLIALLFSTCLAQRDRMNYLEYNLSNLFKEFEKLKNTPPLTNK